MASERDDKEPIQQSDFFPISRSAAQKAVDLFTPPTYSRSNLDRAHQQLSRTNRALLGVLNWTGETKYGAGLITQAGYMVGIYISDAAFHEQARALNTAVPELTPEEGFLMLRDIFGTDDPKFRARDEEVAKKMREKFGENPDESDREEVMRFLFEQVDPSRPFAVEGLEKERDRRLEEFKSREPHFLASLQSKAGVPWILTVMDGILDHYHLVRHAMELRSLRDQLE